MKQTHGDFIFSSEEVTLAIEEFSERYIKPAVTELAKRYPSRERHAERNALIRAEYWRRRGARGLLQEMAQKYGLTPPRIHQIVHGRVRHA